MHHHARVDVYENVGCAGKREAAGADVAEPAEGIHHDVRPPAASPGEERRVQKAVRHQKAERYLAVIAEQEEMGELAPSYRQSPEEERNGVKDPLKRPFYVLKGVRLAFARHLRDLERAPLPDEHPDGAAEAQRLQRRLARMKRRLPDGILPHLEAKQPDASPEVQIALAVPASGDGLAEQSLYILASCAGRPLPRADSGEDGREIAGVVSEEASARHGLLDVEIGFHAGDARRDAAPDPRGDPLPRNDQGKLEPDAGIAGRKPRKRALELVVRRNGPSRRNDMHGKDVPGTADRIG